MELEAHGPNTFSKLQSQKTQKRRHIFLLTSLAGTIYHFLNFSWQILFLSQRGAPCQRLHVIGYSDFNNLKNAANKANPQNATTKSPGSPHYTQKYPVYQLFCIFSMVNQRENLRFEINT